MTAALAVHLWSVDALVRADLPAALDLVVDAGFTAVETMGFGAVGVRAAGAMLAERGLTVCAAHVPFPAGPESDSELATYAALGVDTIAWSLEPHELASAEALARGVERVNVGAERAAGFGMQVAYHNHFAEFEHTHPGPDGPLRSYELLQRELDPRVVLELDVYWPRVVGADAATAAAAAVAARREVRLVHLKDGPATGMADVMTPVTAESPGVLDTLESLPDLRWAVVELDRVQGPMTDALSTSRANLLATGLVVEGRAA
ncbi:MULTISPECIES: sugar phosphate isomerase/epimerase family protein [unclassified Isoptericola]|uniref:sugar phosphate isomerase/epimerase family protein n=1 Tax=unclassified Isoptericola TaxID=2623355 RepID=UPI00364D5537